MDMLTQRLLLTSLTLAERGSRNMPENDLDTERYPKIEPPTGGFEIRDMHYYENLRWSKLEMAQKSKELKDNWPDFQYV
jgi:hypothetical protein